MAPSSRDRISVDLHGLKAALFERAQALGVSPSDLVRTTLADALGRADPGNIDRSSQDHGQRRIAVTRASHPTTGCAENVPGCALEAMRQASQVVA